MFGVFGSIAISVNGPVYCQREVFVSVLCKAALRDRFFYAHEPNQAHKGAAPLCFPAALQKEVIFQRPRQRTHPG